MPREEALARILRHKRMYIECQKEKLGSGNPFEVARALDNIAAATAWLDDYYRREQAYIKLRDEKAKRGLEMENLKLQNKLLKRKLAGK